MTSQSIPQNSSTWAAVRAFASRPLVASVLVIAYVGLAILALLSLDRGNLLFPLLSTLAFPPLVLSPFVILAVPVDGRLKLLLLLAVLLIAMPLIGMYDSSYLELAIQICIFTGLALGLNIVVGFAGLLDLGYIAFFAVGAYTWAMFTSQVDTIFNINGWLVPGWAFYIFLFIGVVVAAGVGVLLGLPVLRLRGDYLAIVTLGFGEMIRVLARNADQPINLTNGSQGLDGVGAPPVPEFIVSIITQVETALGIPIRNVQPLSQQLLFYLIAIVIIALIILAARRLDNSAIGRAWTAIREDEVAAIAMGVPLVRMKLLAFATGASFAGAIGVLYSAKQTFVSPESFNLIQSISILAMVIVGGMGGIRGAMLGAVIVTLLNLQVLKNLSLQINNWRNIDAVLPAPIPTLFLVAIGAVILWLVLRGYRSWYRDITAWVWRLIVIALAALLILSGLSVGDFHIDTWPAQLEPAKYERFIFGILLVIMMIFRPAGLLPEPRRSMELQHAKELETGEERPASTGGRPAGASD